MHRLTTGLATLASAVMLAIGLLPATAGQAAVSSPSARPSATASAPLVPAPHADADVARMAGGKAGPGCRRQHTGPGDTDTRVRRLHGIRQ